MTDRKDIPGVIAPPPLIALAAVLIGLLLDWLVPVYVLATLLRPWWCGFVGGVLVATGVAIGIAGRQRFVEAETNVNPWKPALHLDHGRRLSIRAEPDVRRACWWSPAASASRSPPTGRW